MHRTRRSLRRAQAYRWQPPDAREIVASEQTREQWAAARAKSIAWAAGVVGDPRVVYLDTETTGFGPRAEIVDIAVIGGDGQLLLESLVRPERRIPREVTAVHGITDADVRGAPTWDELYDEVAGVLADRRIIVYNVLFDRQMVNQACERYALSAPAADWECAMRKYAGFFGNWDPGKRWYRFIKLERAVLDFGAEPGGHRAAADALACRAVVLGMAATAPPALESDFAAGNSGLERPWHVPAFPSPSPGAVETAPRPPLPERPREDPDARAAWERAARDFRLFLEAFPNELRERPGACGDWSARDVIAHIAGWEWEAARRLRLIAADPALPDVEYRVDEFNAANVAIRSRQNWSAMLSELDRASHALSIAAAGIPDDSRTREWLLSIARDVAQHEAALRHWLAGMTPRGDASWQGRQGNRRP